MNNTIFSMTHCLKFNLLFVNIASSFTVYLFCFSLINIYIIIFIRPICYKSHVFLLFNVHGLLCFRKMLFNANKTCWFNFLGWCCQLSLLRLQWQLGGFEGWSSGCHIRYAIYKDCRCQYSQRDLISNIGTRQCRSTR